MIWITDILAELTNSLSGCQSHRKRNSDSRSSKHLILIINIHTRYSHTCIHTPTPPDCMHEKIVMKALPCPLSTHVLQRSQGISRPAAPPPLLLLQGHVAKTTGGWAGWVGGWVTRHAALEVLVTLLVAWWLDWIVGLVEDHFIPYSHTLRLLYNLQGLL